MAYKRTLSRREKEDRKAIWMGRMLWVQSLALVALGVYCIGVLKL